MSRFSGRILLSEAEIQTQTRRVAAEVDAHYAFLRPAGQTLTVIGILKGGVPFFTDLTRQMETPMRWDFAEVASYGRAQETSGEVTLVRPPTEGVEGRHVLLVDDVVDSGLTQMYLLRWMAEHGASSVRFAACVDKTARRVVSLTPDFFAFRVADGYLFGYGMDLEGGCRALENIWVAE